MTAAALLVAIALGLGPAPSCARVTPLLASEPLPVIAGNFRDVDGGCYVWLNVRYRWTRRTACKAAAHELGHLNGLPHSSDPLSVMYSPFRPRPVPAQCDR